MMRQHLPSARAQNLQERLRSDKPDVSLLSHFRPALVDGVADRAAIDTSRKLLAPLAK
jgi:hypothetical protein